VLFIDARKIFNQIDAPTATGFRSRSSSSPTLRLYRDEEVDVALGSEYCSLIRSQMGSTSMSLGCASR